MDGGVEDAVAPGDGGPIETPNPLSVTPVLDVAHGAGATVTADMGGTVTATGADGSIFELTIPPNALAEDTAVMLIPLSKVEGLPFSGGLQAGVQLEPDGLVLFQNATLTIQPATAVAASRQIGFGYHGYGAEFHLVPLFTTALTFSIQALAGYGGGLGDEADVTAEEHHAPTANIDQFDQLISAGYFAERPDVVEKDPPLHVPPCVPSNVAQVMAYASSLNTLASMTNQPDTVLGDAISLSTVALQLSLLNAGGMMGQIYNDEMTVVGWISKLINKYISLVDPQLKKCTGLTDNDLDFYLAVGAQIVQMGGPNTITVDAAACCMMTGHNCYSFYCYGMAKDGTQSCSRYYQIHDEATYTTLSTSGCTAIHRAGGVGDLSSKTSCKLSVPPNPGCCTYPFPGGAFSPTMIEACGYYPPGSVSTEYAMQQQQDCTTTLKGVWSTATPPNF
jgi:hypothetical protein